MNMDKPYITTTGARAIPRTDRRPQPPSSGSRPGVKLFTVLLEIPPAAYVVMTGQAPVWARVWMASWLAVWMIATVILAAQNQGTS